MAISPLLPATVRLLGASTTLASPHHLVKELLDNAIDAQATTVEIAFSADTLDSISVRDNGHGIAVDDFEALGRRVHTSKLRSFDELQTKGGKTLGFRGEALASANAVSSITITTRTSSDPVASRMQLRSPVGGVERRRPVSAPLGTTVQTTQLFKNMPARKQYFRKDRNKCVSSIRGLLQSYALARPYLRLSFRVTDDAAQSWSYFPNGSPSVREAALQSFGGSLANNCVHLIIGENDQCAALHSQQPTGFVLDAFLPRPDCDNKAFVGKGSFISVDQRPVSPSRGLPKKVVDTLKYHFSEHMARRASAKSHTSPFIRLDIRCPSHAYDPNVSPLKDEVLFADDGEVIQRFDALCKKLYGGEASSCGDSLEKPRVKGPSLLP